MILRASWLQGQSSSGHRSRLQNRTSPPRFLLRLRLYDLRAGVLALVLAVVIAPSPANKLALLLARVIAHEPARLIALLLARVIAGVQAPLIACELASK